MDQPAETFSVPALQVFDPPLSLPLGVRGLANLTLRYGPLEVRGLVLTQHPDGDYGIQLPHAKHHRRIVIRGEEARRAAFHAALTAYHALSQAPAQDEGVAE